MRKFLFLLVLFLLGGGVLFFFAREKVNRDFARPIPYPTSVASPATALPKKASGPEKQSIFVPYWATSEKSTEKRSYDTYIYFGLAASTNGINTADAGMQSLDTFLALVPEKKEKLLTLRMIESETNFAVLKNEDSQRRLIKETIEQAKKHHFDGIVLDLEVSAIPFDSLVQQINTFNGIFYEEVKKNNLSFTLTLYGDVFYRLRPFDVKTLSQHADRIMIMAYDFSKAKGNPGPNFPLHGADTYGYDYEKMIADFLQVVPAKKITVIFGLFGYDWVVDGQGRTLQQGKAVTSHEIESKFIESCQQRSCSFGRDTEAFETQINYVHKDGSKHIIWFEDMESVEAKKTYLKEHGINSFSYWAYSYF